MTGPLIVNLFGYSVESAAGVARRGRVVAAPLLVIFTCLSVAAQEPNLLPTREGKVAVRYDRSGGMTSVALSQQLDEGEAPFGLSLFVAVEFPGTLPKPPEGYLLRFVYVAPPGAGPRYESTHRVTFIADGESIRLGKADYSAEPVAGRLMETMQVAVPTADFRKMARAVAVETLLGGTALRLSAAQRAKWREFDRLATQTPSVTGYAGLPSANGREEPERPDVAQTVERHLAEIYGTKGYQTYWYDSIAGLSVRGGTVTVRTTLTAKDETAGRICGAVSGFLFSDQNCTLGLDNVQVLGSDGQTLIRRRGLAEPCL